MKGTPCLAVLGWMVLAVALPSAAGEPAKQEIKTAAAPAAIGPFSQGIRAGDFLFLSGQIPLDPATGQIVAGGIEEQARRVLQNIREVLKAGGLDMQAVVKATVFLKNMDDYSTVNQIYGSFFQPPFPARSAVQVARLPKDVLIEIEVIAYCR